MSPPEDTATTQKHTASSPASPTDLIHPGQIKRAIMALARVVILAKRTNNWFRYHPYRTQIVRRAWPAECRGIAWSRPPQIKRAMSPIGANARHGPVGFGFDRLTGIGASGRDDHRVTFCSLKRGRSFSPRTAITDGDIVAIPGSPALSGHDLALRWLFRAGSLPTACTTFFPMSVSYYGVGTQRL